MDEMIQSLIFSADREARQRVRGELEARLAPKLSVEEVETMSRAVDRILLLKPHAAFLDLSTDPEEITRIAPELREGSPATKLIGVYDPLRLPDRIDESKMFLDAIRAGFFDFLRMPMSPVDVTNVIQRLRSEKPGAPGQGATLKVNKTVSFFSNKGGVGKTTLASNLAVALAQHAPGDVAIVDCSFQLGNIREFFGLDPQYTFYDAYMARERLDRDMLMGLMSYHEMTKLYILDTPRKIEQGITIADEAVTQVLLAIRSAFRYVVVDTLPLFNAVSLAIGDLSDHMVVVTEAIVPTIKGTRGLLEFMKDAGYGEERTKIVLNRYAPGFAGNIDAPMVAQTLGRSIDYVLPYERRLHQAANLGIPYVFSRPERSFSQVIRRMAEDLGGLPSRAKKGSWWSRLLEPLKQ